MGYCVLQIMFLLALAVCHTSALVLGQEDVGAGEQLHLLSTRLPSTNSKHPAHPLRLHPPEDHQNQTCTDAIGLWQGPTSPLPSGIPAYLVEICNMCQTNCSAYDIHLSCGWFSSARLINPSHFRRLRFDDCLVNDGKEFEAGRCISFAYANLFPYRLAVSTSKCMHPQSLH
ncbi:hypothetical protein MKW94_017227 [Papaver nudicaule]|uniref:Uncharacterized protein n=1 Tax=Papaver nudicaule TaxID=74823 RepID=A0AA41RZU1_PAPNU|nr:hypothetical protein [Papaver nudicaule]